MSPAHLRAAALALLLGACDRAPPAAPPPAASASAEAPLPAAGSALSPAAAQGAAPLPSAAPAAPTASSAVEHALLPPTIFEEPPGDEKTAAPTKAEWATAKPVRLGRITDARCSATRLREWLRVFCKSDRFHGFSMLGGLREGIDVKVRNEDPDAGLTLVFPVRRGDVRVIELTRWVKWGVEADVLVSEQWLSGDKGPLITVTGVP